MKNTEQTITLTPPIDGVQYGYNSDEIKVGDYFYWYDPDGDNRFIWKCFGLTDNTHYHVKYLNNEYPFPEGDWNKSYAKKVVLSTNPKDTRFPFLVMPSKEQEHSMENAIADRQANEEGLARYGKDRRLGFYDFIHGYYLGFNANKGVYTQEQMEKAVDLAREKQFVNVLGECDKYDIDEIIQSIQPTAKAVRVEMEEVVNMDYKPSFGGGSDGHYNPMYIEQIKVETSSEYSQGIVRAIEVIY